MSFVHDDPDFVQVLRFVSDEMRIDPSLVEKDYWVTHCMWALHQTGLELWFKGGTSLSKGYGVIKRFSEDLDLMVQHGTVDGLPAVANWTSVNKGPIAARRAFYEALPGAFVIPAVKVEIDEKAQDKYVRGINLVGRYPGVLLDQLSPTMSPYVFFEIGRARVVPFVEKPLTSFVHDWLERHDQLGGYTDNRPRAVRCVHPLVTLAAATGAPKVGAAATAGAPNSLGAGTVKSQLDALLGFVNGHINLAAGAHAAAAVTYAGGGNWADGTANPATTVEAQLDKVVSDLAATTGAPKVGAAATAGAPNSLGAGTVRSQLDALLGFINGHINLAAGAHAAAAVTYAGGGNWADGTTNPATTVEAQLDKVISDLVAGAGAARVGAAASGNLPAGTVRSQLDALDVTSVRTNVANIFTALQTFNGAAGDTNGAIATTAAPTTRKLLWEFAINASYKGRLYSSVSFNGAFEITINARWDGAQWVRDSSSLFSVKWTFHNYEWRIDVKTGTGNFADNTWTGFHRFEFPSSAPNNIIYESSGEKTCSGPLTGYSATEAEWGSTNANIGGGASFASGRLPAAPSSVTFTVKSSAGTTGSPTAFATDRMGVGWFCGTTGSLPATRYMFLTFTAS